MMASATPALGDSVYQLKIVLTGISPMIWRRVLVRSSTTIAELHAIIQIAMGWEDNHLNRFHIYGKDYGVCHDGGMTFSDDPQQVQLSDFQFCRNDRFQYEYNFYAAWQHDIRVEAILSVQPDQYYPVCISGKHACPPESARDAWHYQAQLRQLKWLRLLDQRELNKVIGEANPFAFHRRKVNQRFKDKEHLHPQPQTLSLD
jgi:hypothetical protein